MYAVLCFFPVALSLTVQLYICLEARIVTLLKEATMRNKGSTDNNL